MGLSGRFYSFIYLPILMIGTGHSWLELPVQGRLCPISVSRVELPDIHECFRGLTGSQRTHGFGASQLGIRA